MRIAVGDKAAHCGGVRVFLNGEEMRRVVEADEEAGYIVRTAVGPSGRPLISRDGLVHETLRGHVRIEMPSRADSQ